MPKRPNKLRYLGYQEDGVYGYQCMRCGEYFNLQHSPSFKPVQFCPHCGTCWEAGHIWSRPKRWDLIANIRHSEYQAPRMRWVLQENNFFGRKAAQLDGRNEDTAWDSNGAYTTLPGDRLELVRYVRQLRGEEEANEPIPEDRTLYRLVRVCS